MRTRTLLAMTMLLAGCTADPSINVKHRVPNGGTIAVAMFQDCDIANQPDCDGSGAKAGAIFVRALSQSQGLHAVSLPRPVGPKAQFNDDAAVAYAKAKGYRYVINGEVTDYYGSGHLGLHSDRAGVSVRVLSTSDGQALASYTYQDNSKTHLSTPDEMLESMAGQLADSIVDRSKRKHQGHFMIYKENGGS
jgi:TolB-like protein